MYRINRHAYAPELSTIEYINDETMEILIVTKLSTTSFKIYMLQDEEYCKTFINTWAKEHIAEAMGARGWELRGEYTIQDKLCINKKGDIECDYMLDDTFSEYTTITLYQDSKMIKSWEFDSFDSFVIIRDNAGRISEVHNATVEDVTTGALAWVQTNA